jgi:hypothetical protein
MAAARDRLRLWDGIGIAALVAPPAVDLKEIPR